MVVLKLLGFTDLPTGKLSGATTIRWVKNYLLENFLKQNKSIPMLEEFRRILASDTSVVWCGQARCKTCVELEILCVQEPTESSCAILQSKSDLTNMRRTIDGGRFRKKTALFDYWAKGERAEVERLRKEAVEVNPPRFDQSRAEVLELQICQAWAEESAATLEGSGGSEAFAGGLDELKTWGVKYYDVAGGDVADGGFQNTRLLVERILRTNDRMAKLRQNKAKFLQEAAQERAKLERKANNEIEDLRKAVTNQVIESMKMRDNAGQRGGTTAVEPPILAELRQTIYKELAELRGETEALRELRLEATATTVELNQLRQAAIDQTKQHEAAVSALNKEILELRDELQRKESRLQKMSDLQAVENGRNHEAVSKKRKHDLALQFEAEKRRAYDFDCKGKQSLARAAELHARIMDIEADLESRDESVVEGLRKEVAGLRETLAKQSPGVDPAEPGTSPSIGEADLLKARRHALKAALSLGVITPRQVPDDEKEVESGPDERLDDPNEDMQVEPDEEGDNARAGKRQRTD